MDLEYLLERERALKELVVADETQEWHPDVPPRMIAFREDEQQMVISAYDTGDPEMVGKMFTVMVAGTSAPQAALFLDVKTFRDGKTRDSMVTVTGDRDGNVDYVEQYYTVDGPRVEWDDTARHQWRNGLKGESWPMMNEVREALLTPNSMESALIADALSPEWVAEDPHTIEALMVVITVAAMNERGAQAVGCFDKNYKDVVDGVIGMIRHKRDLGDIAIVLY
jgi:hypothetical protein